MWRPRLGEALFRTPGKTRPRTSPVGRPSRDNGATASPERKGSDLRVQEIAVVFGDAEEEEEDQEKEEWTGDPLAPRWRCAGAQVRQLAGPESDPATAASNGFTLDTIRSA